MNTNSYRLFASLTCVLLCLLLASCSPTLESNQQSLVLPSGNEALVNLRAYTQVWHDTTAALPIQGVVKRAAEFQAIEARYIDFDLTEDRIWLRSTLVNPANTRQVWRLDLGRQYLKRIDVYLVAPGEPPLQVFATSSSDSFSQRSIPRRSLMVDFELPPQAPVDVYIGYQSFSTTFLPVTIGRPAGVVAARGAERMLDMFMNGALAAMLVTALLMFRVIGVRLALCFAAYILAGSLYVAHADGYTVKYFWPDSAQLNDALNMSFMLLMTSAGMNFAREMFSFHNTLPAYGRFLMAMSLLALLVSLSASVFPNNYWLMILGYPLTPICSVVQVVTGVIALRLGFAGAIPYLLGAIGVATSFVYAFAAHMLPGQLSLDATLDYGHLMLLFECFAFGAAIAARLLNVSRERDLAQQAELGAVRDKLAMSDTLRQTQQQYLEARRVSTERRQLLSSVSHDMRQPLGMLRRGFEQLAVNDESEAESLHNALDYLEQLATDQIQSKPDSSAQSDGTLEIFPIAVVLQSVYEMFNTEAQEKGLQLALHNTGNNVCADPVAVMRVMSNLVHNAIRHTAKGDVVLRAHKAGEKLRVEVADSGPGMSSAEQARVKERYQKRNDSPGDGLGLAIVEELSVRHGLEFEIHSDPGQGTRASIALPLA